MKLAPEELQKACRDLTDGQGYFGLAPLRQYAAELDRAGLGIGERVRLQGLLGREQLKLGRLEEAIDTFGKALEETPGLGQRDRLQWLRLHLALAHLQAAEDRNCVFGHSAESCILPFRGGALHREPEHGRAAGDLLAKILAEEPNHIEAAWLLNLARMATADFPAGVPETYRLPVAALWPDSDFAAWPNRAPQLGLDVVDLAGGAVMEDLDGDGLLDLVTTTWDPCDGMKAFRNDGQGRFEDVTSAWGLEGQLGGLNLVQADYDNDGRIDLLVLRGAWLFEEGRIRNSLLRNRVADGKGFVDVTAAAGLATPAYPTQAGVWGDYDGDGDLDLYVGNESAPETPFPSQLFRNNSDGTFTDVAPAAGVTNDRYAKAAAWGDYDDDGDLDLYVSNLMVEEGSGDGRNRLYRNDGKGAFTDVALELAVTEPEGRSFATWFMDVDNDGDLDLFVADYGSPLASVAAAYFGFPVDRGQPVLYRNDGGKFTDVSRQAGLTRPVMAMGANYGDLDNDGYPDVYLGTGDPEFQSLVPNVMLHNRGGTRFEDVTFAGGFGHLQKGHGIAFGDLDNDGDQDIFHQLGGFYPADSFANALFENPGTDGRWITLRLEGREANRSGVGARIEVQIEEGETERSIHVLAGTGGSFGGSSLQQEIGLGAATAIRAVVVRWPGSGIVQTVGPLALDSFYRIVEGDPEPKPMELPRLELGCCPG